MTDEELARYCENAAGDYPCNLIGDALMLAARRLRELSTAATHAETCHIAQSTCLRVAHRNAAERVRELAVQYRHLHEQALSMGTSLAMREGHARFMAAGWRRLAEMGRECCKQADDAHARGVEQGLREAMAECEAEIDRLHNAPVRERVLGHYGDKQEGVEAIRDRIAARLGKEGGA